MTRKKGGLGRGLGSLLGEGIVDIDSPASEQVTTETVALASLLPNPYQPRTTFDEAAIEALADSIRQHGVIQPLAVRPKNDGYYEIIAGERRFRASKRAGLTEVPVVVHDIDDENAAVFALIENLQREDLNVIEKAKGIAALIQQFHLTHEACGKVLGQSRSAISNTLRLLDLSEPVQQAVSEGAIDMGHARALLPLEHAEQAHVLQQIRLRGLTVRETEALVRSLQNDTGEKVTRPQKTSEVKRLEGQLSRALNTKVVISQKETGDGKITLAFNDAGMLDKLIKRLGIEE